MSVPSHPRVLATKLHVPLGAASRVPRTRLDALLRRGITSRLTLVSASAGAGKTSAVADWLARDGIEAGWVSLDDRDRTPSSFLLHVVAAIARTCPGFVDEVSVPLEAGQLDPETAAIIVLDALAEPRAPQPIVLVLDDVHYIEGSESESLLALIVEHAPPSLRLVLTTRADPDLPLARLRARGQLTEIRAPDLRFRTDEAASLLESTAAVTLPPAVLAQLDARTEGWAVGLHMAALGLRGHADPAAFVATFSGSHRFVLDYLLEEVLARMTAPDRARLLAVSIVEQLDAELVDAIAGTDDGAAWLEQLDASNLFVIALDDRRARFRFHHLFRTLLQHELEASTTAEQRQRLHRRAAAILHARGHVEEALQHWQSAQAWDEVEQLVLDHTLASLIRSDLRHIGRDFVQIPEAVLEERPALAVRHYWVATNEVTPQVVRERLYARAQRALGRRFHADAAAELALCEAETLRHRDVAFVRERLEAAARVLADRPGPLAVLLHITRAHESMILDRFDEAFEAVEQMLAAALAADDLYPTLWARWYQAHAVLVRGEPLQAREHLVALEADVRALAIEPPPSAALALASLAHAQLELGDLDEASRWLDEAQAFVDPRMAPSDAIEIVLARMWLEGLRDPNGVDWVRAYERGQVLARAARAPEAVARLEAVRVRILLDARRRDDPSPSLRAWLEQPGIADGSHPLFCSKAFPSTRPGLALRLRARVLARLGHHARATAELPAVLAAAESAGRHVCIIEAHLALAELAELAGAPAEHHDDHVRRALAHAAPRGIVAPFVGQSPRRWARVLDLAPARVPPPMHERLRALASSPSPAAPGPRPPAEPLSDRELEVLAGVAEGLSNAELARRLYVAPSTVKTHLENIYGKLGVRRRTQAVARARGLGLLA